MTEESMQNSDAILTPESIQAKVDILENNIYQDIKKLEGDTLAQIKVSRANTINIVLEKAVSQVLFRFNIHPSILGEEFKDSLLATADPKSSPMKIQRAIQGGFMDQGSRQLEIAVSPKLIVIQIQGVKPITEKNESIVKIYFEHESHPGRLLPNGKIDFRELHKFPSVKVGDNLLFATYPVQGKPGISYEGKIVPVGEPTLLDMTYQEGVIKKEYVDKDGRTVGYFLVAAKTGVVVIKKEGSRMSDIDVRDRIELETIDFSIGNIGSEFVSPVSMKIGTVNNGFKLRAKGDVTVTSLDGGHIYTDKSVVVDQCRPGSTIEAKDHVTVRSVMDSDIVSAMGPVTIKDELRDSKLTAPEVIFKTSQSIMLNSTIETLRMELKNVYYCGVNKIYLGRDTFQKRRDILEDIEKVDKRRQDIGGSIELLKSNLLGGLKKLAVQISDQKLLNMFKLLIHSLQTFTFSDSFKVLANLRENMNVMQIDQLKKTFQELEKLSIALQELDQTKSELDMERENLEAVINTIKINLKGKINPTATIKIYCNKRSMADPIYEIKPQKKEGNEPVSCIGTFHLDTGFKTQ